MIGISFTFDPRTTKMQATAYIVDDERKSRELVRVLLAKRHPSIRVLGESGSAIEAAQAINDKRPDLLFLDVDLGGLDGFDLLKRLAHPRPLIIFTTGDPAHALRAIDAEATHYLVKPFDGPRFDEAVLRAMSALEAGKGPRPLPAAHGMQVSDQQIALPESKGLTMVHLDEVVHCESDNNYTSVFLRGTNVPVVVSKGIMIFEEALSSKGFIRIHQSHLVNKKHIKQYLRGEGGEVLMSNGRNLPVSRRMKPALMDALERI